MLTPLALSACLLALANFISASPTKVHIVDEQAQAATRVVNSATLDGEAFVNKVHASIVCNATTHINLHFERASSDLVSFLMTSGNPQETRSGGLVAPLILSMAHTRCRMDRSRALS